MVKNDWSPSTSMTPREKYHWAGGVGGNHCRQRNIRPKVSENKNGTIIVFRGATN